jgi:hypothetical protein
VEVDAGRFVYAHAGHRNVPNGTGGGGLGGCGLGGGMLGGGMLGGCGLGGGMLGGGGETPAATGYRAIDVVPVQLPAAQLWRTYATMVAPVGLTNPCA